MATFLEALQQVTRTFVCSSIDSAAALYRELPGGTQGDFTKIALSFGSYVSRLFCNKEPPPPPDGVDGGQCPVDYEVISTIRRTNAEVPGNNQEFTGLGVVARGPIQGLTFVTSGEGDQTTTDVFLVHSAAGPGLPTTTRIGGFNVGTPGDKVSGEITSITRVDGLPDNCGNTPPTIDPYDPDDFRTITNITYTNNDGIDVTIPVGLLIAPVFVDADVNLNIPVKVSFDPEFNFDPTFNYDIQLDINVGTGDITPRPPVPRGDTPPRLPPPPDFDFDFPNGIDNPAPPSPPDVPDAPPAQPDPERTAVIRGAIVTVTEIDEPNTVGILFQGNNPDVYYPDLGLVSFQIRTRNGTAWTTDIKVKNKRQLIACEWGGGAIAVQATPRLGVQLNVTPVYGAPDDDF